MQSLRFTVLYIQQNVRTRVVLSGDGDIVRSQSCADIFGINNKLFRRENDGIPLSFK